MDVEKSIRQKALEINLNQNIFGTIAEIGAGQEIARRFFIAGGASGTVAKTISAYDMAISDSIYGETKTKRYVSEERLKKMLSVEFDMLKKSIFHKKSNQTTFFAFANTVEAINFHKTNKSHGWLGIKYQLRPGHDPNEIIVHINLLEKDNFLQQRTLGILGVNLIYAAYHYYNYPNTFIKSLLDYLSTDQIEIDVIKMSGPELDYVDNRLLSLQLVKNNMSSAALFDFNYNVKRPSDEFYKKNILVIRGSFRPITNVTLDMLKTSMEELKKDKNINTENTFVFCEISLESLLTKTDFDESDFLNRVELICELGINVMVSGYKYHFEFIRYLQNCKIKNIGLVMGAATFQDIFNKNYYENLNGGILQAFGRLIVDNIKLFIYPSINNTNSDELLTSKNIDVPEYLIYLYKYILTTGKIIDIEAYDKDNLDIFAKEIIIQIKEQKTGWEKKLPEAVTIKIKEKNMFDYNN